MITYKAKTASGEIINSALTPFAFPAGEAHVKREDRRALEPVEIAILQPSPDSIHDDLFHLGMWSNYILWENADRPSGGPSKRVALIPYFPGARADRGRPFGLGIYADFIRSLELDQIIIFDPHSGMTGDALHAAAEKLTFIRPSGFFAQPTMRKLLGNYAGIIAPDKGAVDRASAVADLAGIPVYIAEKTRNFETGKLSGFTLDGLPTTGKFLVVDDICDGGGTFMGLAEATGLPKERLDLYVSHGVFSGAATTNLQNAFGRVYTTNSYAPKSKLNWTDWRDGKKWYAFKRFDVIRLLLDQIDV